MQVTCIAIMAYRFDRSNSRTLLWRIGLAHSNLHMFLRRAVEKLRTGYARYYYLRSGKDYM